MGRREDRDDGRFLREGSQALDRGGRRDKAQRPHCIMRSPHPSHV